MAIVLTGYSKRTTDGLSRSFFLAATPQVIVADVVNAATLVNKSVVEISYVGRSSGAVQVVSSDGGAVSGTFKVQGSLRPTVVTNDPVLGLPKFNDSSIDTDYVDLGTITNTGIFQIPANTSYARIRVICSAYTSGNAKVWIL